MSKVLVSSYQCSESTSASEVSLLFKRAEERQSNFDRYQTEAFVQQERCCVFLDEVVRFERCGVFGIIDLLCLTFLYSGPSQRKTAGTESYA